MLEIKKENGVYFMDKNNEPCLRIKSGSNVIFETYDCFENQIQSEDQSIDSLNWNRINPATGPLYVEGAREGDTLKVRIIDIEVSNYGIMAAIPGAGLLGDQVLTPEIKRVSIEGEMVWFNEEISLPLNPMIGVIGVAPKGDPIPCGTPGAHGGNMDNKKIKKATTLYLPVFVEGGLLAIGDLHAAMGDGEIMVSGVEVPGRVTVKVEVIKNKQIAHPLLEDEGYFYTIASHEELLVAVKLATSEMQKHVMEQLKLSFNEAGMLLSAAGNVEVCQVVDPLLTVRFSMSKAVLKKIF
ncbi:Acetamidase/Formamidase [Alkaliphilus metalliredigens QYMF]|uniref:Acetamidase/Formamidase n=1 Tax=Alkaliphilus metalliredigens (strain QYMF) TaxID=293826 RepID=A6TSA4_ALKMQ|nr:acetamidase/formamidase family protein [Alkaliphilus metalliredigens]ABR49072.1 Acetamidase/Formamidase [Alkaliphilus metalliredigens QYMF]